MFIWTNKKLNITIKFRQYSVFFHPFAGIDDGEIEAGEQTVYACSGRPLVLQCGENDTSDQQKVSELYANKYNNTREHKHTHMYSVLYSW